jgi:hypothetical protein
MSFHFVNSDFALQLAISFILDQNYCLLFRCFVHGCFSLEAYKMTILNYIYCIKNNSHYAICYFFSSHKMIKACMCCQLTVCLIEWIKCISVFSLVYHNEPYIIIKILCTFVSQSMAHFTIFILMICCHSVIILRKI